MHIVTLLLTRLPYISVYFIVKCTLVNKLAADRSPSAAPCGFSRRSPHPVRASPPALGRAQPGPSTGGAWPSAHRVAVTGDGGAGPDSGGGATSRVCGVGLPWSPAKPSLPPPTLWVSAQLPEGQVTLQTVTVRPCVQLGVHSAGPDRRWVCPAPPRTPHLQSSVGAPGASSGLGHAPPTQRVQCPEHGADAGAAPALQAGSRFLKGARPGFHRAMSNVRKCYY